MDRQKLPISEFIWNDDLWDVLFLQVLSLEPVKPSLLILLNLGRVCSSFFKMTTRIIRDYYDDYKELADCIFSKFNDRPLSFMLGQVFFFFDMVF